MNKALSLTRKELDSYFSSPMALIFVGVFLVITLFTFFWVDSFFGRGIADVRALFQWMPVLLIFLVAALTMRQWSEEEQTGTLQVLLTMPIGLAQLVIGKFLSVLALVIVALALTVFIPITVGTLGNLDIGPVIGGYLAAILMASAYIAIGLFISSRTDNQIVALILTVIACGFFHLIGSPAITDLFNVTTAEILRAIGTGSRFESIERGVVDLRDLIYYLSLTVFFLGLNVLSLDSKRWSSGAKMSNYRRNSIAAAFLVGVNLLVLNILLYPVTSIRLDLTQYQEYTLSPVTEDLLDSLQEPLLIRGYFSEENHPLLAPLVPRVRDTLREYQVASNGGMELEFIDPLTDPELEREANQTYGIRPTPLQISDRGGVSLINAYFDILIRYGDQSAVLNFGDLIEVEQTGNETDVRLRNLEYDLTSSIQRVVFGFQSLDSVLASFAQPATLTLYYTPESLPEALQETPDAIFSIAQDIQSRSNGNFVFNAVDISQPNAPIDPNTLFERYQIQPVITDVFSAQSFYLHMVAEVGDEFQVIFPSGGLSDAEIRASIEAALKRLSPGFLQVVGVWLPPNEPPDDVLGEELPSFQQYSFVASSLQENYEVRAVNLATGQVPAAIDVLVMIAPQELSPVEQYAVDQYLMRGGALFVATSPYRLVLDQSGGLLRLQPAPDGVNDLLAHYGVTVGEQLVLDLQNEPFPVPVTRNVGGVPVQEIQAVDFPHFIDVRPNNMSEDSLVTSGIQAISVNWASPLTIDEPLNAEREVTVLLQSSENSWVTNDPNIQPDLQVYPQLGFPSVDESEMQQYPLAVSIRGSFNSFFADQPSPFEQVENAPPAPASFIDESPAGTRLIVVSSAEFVNDNVFQISSSISGERFLNTVQFVLNGVDWFAEDSALASIRSGGSSARLLDVLTEEEQSTWEILNYVMALLALIGLGVVWRMRKVGEKPMELLPPENSDSSQPPLTPSYQGGD